MRDDLRLIREIKARPLLYHMKHVHHSNKQQREQDWLNIAEKLKLTTSVCKTRWRSLRDRFVREWKKVNSANGTEKLKIWPLLPYLKFLKDHIKERRNYQQNMDPAEDPFSIDDDYDEEDYFEPLTEQTECKIVSEPVPQDISLDPEFKEYMLMINNQKEQDQLEENDPIKENSGSIELNNHCFTSSRHNHFLSVLVEKLDQLSDEECEDVKMDLLNHVHKAVKARKTR